MDLPVAGAMRLHHAHTYPPRAQTQLAALETCVFCLTAPWSRRSARRMSLQFYDQGSCTLVVPAAVFWVSMA